MSNIKTVYTQDEVKAMMQACLKGINAPNRILPALDIDEDDSIYQILYDMQNQFSQILRILSAEYNEICEAVEAFEGEENDDEDK